MKILFKNYLVIALVTILLAVLYHVWKQYNVEKDPPIPEITEKYRCKRNGKDLCKVDLPTVYSLSDLEHLDMPLLDDKMLQALKHHQKLLKIRKQKAHQVVGNLNLSVKELRETIEAMISNPDPAKFNEKLDAYRISGVKGTCLLYTSPSPRDRTRSRMPSSA